MSKVIITEEQKAKYRAYLVSEKWRSFKETILRSRGHKCEFCGKKDRPLDLHHLTYCRLYNEYQEDVVLLCRECHSEQHSKKNVGVKFMDVLMDSVEIVVTEVKKTRVSRNCTNCNDPVPVGSRGFTIGFLNYGHQSAGVCYDCGKLIDGNKALIFRVPYAYGRIY